MNTQWRFTDRRQFEINCERWEKTLPNAERIQDYLIAFLNDVGSGLETLLYEEAIIYSLGGHETTDSAIQVSVAGQTVGQQNMHMLSNGLALKVTSLDRSLDAHELHTRRLLAHTNEKMTSPSADVHRMFYDACRAGGVKVKDAKYLYWAVANK